MQDASTTQLLVSCTTAVQLMKTFVVETSMFGNLLHTMLKKKCLMYMHVAMTAV